MSLTQRRRGNWCALNLEIKKNKQTNKTLGFPFLGLTTRNARVRNENTQDAPKWKRTVSPVTQITCTLSHPCDQMPNVSRSMKVTGFHHTIWFWWFVINTSWFFYFENRMLLMISPGKVYIYPMLFCLVWSS